ncbi:helix-turn-helix domain-containing protein [Planosporangium flavigriseum]|nr:helix-turn-helix domain-containing protein [Planosporangium flavigriseum]
MGDRWKAIAALVDQSRRALYDYVRRAGHPVTREEAAEAEGMSRNLTAFHLDKLVESGLLRARYEAPTDQPRGRGRTPKVYELAGDGVAVTIPERRYELIAEILADAVVDAPADAERAAYRHARQRGRDLGAQVRAADAGIVDALAALGFEPQSEPGRVLLRNCPFHVLAARHTGLVCGLNHAFLAGLVDGSGLTDVEARLEPRPGACCVQLTM